MSGTRSIPSRTRASIVSERRAVDAARAPLLRAPPFPGIDAAVTSPGMEVVAEPTPDAINRLFSMVREARVGGSFWAPSSDKPGTGIVLRCQGEAELEPTRALLSAAERETAHLHVRSMEVDPWSMLDCMSLLVAHGDDEWTGLAVIAGVPVRLLSAGRFGAPGDDVARLRTIVAQDLLLCRYRDPFSGRSADIDATIALLAEWRRTLAANRQLVAGCGFSWWKRREIARFLWSPEHRLRFFRSERRAIAYAARCKGAVTMWPSRASARIVPTAAKQQVPLVRVEDGFIRSVGLGSNLVPPSSVTVDRRGIYYDPGAPSDLETLLASADFPPALLERAVRLRETIVAAGISKYGNDAAHIFPSREPGRRLVLVPGQVEDDMSVRLGGDGLASNLELLQRVRALEPDAEIWFRPHPDVDAGHRKGAVRDADALGHADRVVRGGGMAPLLDLVDGVHVLTSLTGFEALLRGRDVTCHGTPFYAGWGLTRDLSRLPDRRGRRLTIEQLIAATLILYPRYLDPVTGLPCPPELLIRRMGEGTTHNRLGWVTALRRVQGRLARART